jgi:hypothetical protein
LPDDVWLHEALKRIRAVDDPSVTPQQVKWAAKQALKWHDGMKAHDCTPGGSGMCFVVVKVGSPAAGSAAIDVPDGTAWIVADKSYAVGYCIRCRVYAAGTTKRCAVDLPFVYAHTSDIMCQLSSVALVAAAAAEFEIRMYKLTWHVDGSRLFGLLAPGITIALLDKLGPIDPSTDEGVGAPRPRKAARISNDVDQDEELLRELEHILRDAHIIGDEAADLFEDAQQ